MSKQIGFISGRIRRSYTEGFKSDTVPLLTDQRDSPAETVRSLPLHLKVIRNRRQKVMASEEGRSTLTEDKKAELKRLREEVRKLQMEPDSWIQASKNPRSAAAGRTSPHIAVRLRARN